MTRRRSGYSCRLLPFAILLTFAIPSLAICAAASAQTLRGRVLDPDARPVGGADVLVLHGESVIVHTKTSSDGRFSASPPASGNYDVLATAPGLRSGPQSVSVGSTGPTDVDLRLAISAVQESVVVSASQVETPLSRTSDSVTVIDRAELTATQTTTVADALRLVPGFSVAASGGPGGLTSLFPRGGQSDYTLVLVDGIPQNVFGGGFDAGHLDTAGVERIEVVGGPESALYGDGAIGGIVQLVTRQGGPLQADASIEGGGYGFSRSTAAASGSAGPWRWAGSFARLVTDGDTRQWPSLNRRIANSDYDRFVGSGSFGWSDGPSRAIRVDVRGGRDIRGVPGPYGSDPEHLYGGLDLISRGHNTSREIGASATLGNAFALRHRV
jgi:outer membrane receptor protein involved in Fe transport